MEWQFSSELPIYSQLVEKIKFKIVSGEYIPGQRFPAVRELAQEAGVNPNTMQRAMQELERQGFLFSLRTSGRYVTEDIQLIEEAKKTMAGDLIEKFLGQMEALGFRQEEIGRLVADHMEGGEGNGNLGV